jgi:hypothetical protein
MKRFILLSFICFNSIAYAQRGSEGVGGGDLCENRIQEIRNDISSWILKGGARDLKLTDISAEKYAQRMLVEAKRSKIKCVGKGDLGYPVEINGTPKVCRFDKTHRLSQITCDYEKFQKMQAAEQYILIHHEYAGLADIERPNGDSSNYEISNQISAYLEDQITKKLVVKPTFDSQQFDKDGRRVRLAAYDIYMLLTQQKNSFIKEQVGNCEYSASYNEKEKTVTISLNSSKSSSDTVTIRELKWANPPLDNFSNYSTFVRVTGDTVGATGLAVSIDIESNYRLVGIAFRVLKLVSRYDVPTAKAQTSWDLKDDDSRKFGEIYCSRNRNY